MRYFIPELKIGIEVDGEYWHRNRYQKERQKIEVFSKLGIYLIRVRDSKLQPVEGHVVWYENREPPQTSYSYSEELILISRIKKSQIISLQISKRINPNIKKYLLDCPHHQ